MRHYFGRKVVNRQTNEKARRGKNSKGREFTPGEEVLVQNVHGVPKWLVGHYSAPDRSRLI